MTTFQGIDELVGAFIVFIISVTFIHDFKEIFVTTVPLPTFFILIPLSAFISSKLMSNLIRSSP